MDGGSLRAGFQLRPASQCLSALRLGVYAVSAEIEDGTGKLGDSTMAGAVTPAEYSSEDSYQ